MKSVTPIGLGHFVIYIDPKKGPLTAHVLEIAGGTLKLRVHQTAQPNFDVDNVEFSATPKKGHWHRR